MKKKARETKTALLPILLGFRRRARAHTHTHTVAHFGTKGTQVDTLGKHGHYEIVALLLWTISGKDVGHDTARKDKQQLGCKGVTRLCSNRGSNGTLLNPTLALNWKYIVAPD